MMMLLDDVTLFSMLPAHIFTCETLLSIGMFVPTTHYLAQNYTALYIISIVALYLSQLFFIDQLLFSYRAIKINYLFMRS